MARTDEVLGTRKVLGGETAAQAVAGPGDSGVEVGGAGGAGHDEGDGLVRAFERQVDGGADQGVVGQALAAPAGAPASWMRWCNGMC
jgi:hypothetical protein